MSKYNPGNTTLEIQDEKKKSADLQKPFPRPRPSPLSLGVSESCFPIIIIIIIITSHSLVYVCAPMISRERGKEKKMDNTPTDLEIYGRIFFPSPSSSSSSLLGWASGRGREGGFQKNLKAKKARDPRGGDACIVFSV
jgi:hypothetical protein